MPSYESKIIHDFNQIALLQEPNWNHNKHYHSFIVQNLPKNCRQLLEVGCGKGELCRRLSPKVDSIVGIDISEKMIEIAKERTPEENGIVFQKVNYLDKILEENQYDCIVSVATLHHIDFEQFAAKVKRELKPKGKLLVIDLYEQETLGESLLELLAIPISGLYKMIKNKHIKPSQREQQIWEEHGESDVYLTISALKGLVKEHFPGGKLKRQLLWRYSLVWEK